MASPSNLRRRREEPATSSNLPELDDHVGIKEHPFPDKPKSPNNSISFGAAFLFLLLARYSSARSNLIHDCDEVFNYWEPLHYILYRSGFQTWEYSSQFSLRSYLYLLIHGLVAGPASWVFGNGPGKIHVFYTLRLALGAVSAATEAALVAAVSLRLGKRVAVYTLVMLCFTCGCYNASTSFLPSTFSMYCLSLATAALLADRFKTAVSVASVGVLVGWPFSGLAFLPLIIYSLINGRFYSVVLSGMISSLALSVLTLLADRYFYGQWTFSVLNLVVYNVAGGGDSSLYGVEGPLYYLHNGLNNFNIALVLALLLPIIAVITWKSNDRHLLISTLPLYVWLGFMSLQSHKEERFLYPVYPLICLAAAAAIERFPDMIPTSLEMHDLFSQVFKVLRPVTLAVVLVLSYSRIISLQEGYSAPMKIYSRLPQENDQTSTVCVGSEWHRFPSSFFLPSPSYDIKWVDDGFQGLLPFSFNHSLGGTKAAPHYFNAKNRASPEQFIRNEDTCNYLVELELERAERSYRSNNGSTWEMLIEVPFLDNEKSPRLYRAFFIPWLWERRNTFGKYKLLRRKNSYSDIN